MSYSKYYAFLKIIECGSLTDAARQLGYTQPGISHMMLSLEEQMGFPLLIRKKNGVTPTADAKKLIPAMQQIVNAEQKLQEQARDINGIKTGVIRIGAYYSLLTNWMPDILQRFTSQYPGVEIHLLEGDQNDMTRWLTSLEVDIALMSPPVPEGYEFLPLAKDPIYAVLPEHHPCSGASQIDPADLMDTPFLIPGSGFDKEFLDVINGENLKPRVRYRIKGDAAMLHLVAKGIGVTFMAGLLLTQLPQGAKKVPLTKTYYRTLGIGVASTRYASPATQKMIAMIQEMQDGQSGGSASALISS